MYAFVLLWYYTDLLGRLVLIQLFRDLAIPHRLRAVVVLLPLLELLWMSLRSLRLFAVVVVPLQARRSSAVNQLLLNTRLAAVMLALKLLRVLLEVRVGVEGKVDGCLFAGAPPAMFSCIIVLLE
jgi:hypothetical protein